MRDSFGKCLVQLWKIAFPEKVSQTKPFPEFGKIRGLEFIWETFGIIVWKSFGIHL